MTPRPGPWFRMRRDFVLPQMIRARVEQDPSRLLVQPIGQAAITAEDFHTDSLRLAAGLEAIGVGRGDTVAMMLEASPQSLLTWIATAWLGATSVGVNEEFRGRPLTHVLSDSRSAILVTHSRYIERLEAVAPELPHLKTIVTVDDADDLDVRWRHHRLADLVLDAAPNERTGPRESDPHSVVYTSGTTGVSKGVICHWAALHEAAFSMFPGDEAEQYDDPALHSYLATSYSGGKMAFLLAVQGGMRLVQKPRFSLSSFWDEIHQYRCTHAVLLSVMPLLWHNRQDSDRANPLRRAYVLPLTPEFESFADFFGISISTAWGSTETGLPIRAANPKQPGACGDVAPGYEVRVVDGDDFEVPAGEVGELIVRHEQPWRIASAYLGRPEETAKAWRNGWFHTGDALRQADDGTFFFVDRIKDYIRHRGHNVSSVELEAEVAAHPGVVSVACIGVREPSTNDALGDEEIMVFAVRSAAAELTEDALYDWLGERLPRFMLPRYIEFVDSLPLTPTAKVRKVELRQRGVTERTWDHHDIGEHP